MQIPQRYNYITFTYARACVCVCVCMYVCVSVCVCEPTELNMSIPVSVLPLEVMNHWSPERTNKYIRIIITNQDVFSVKR